MSEAILVLWFAMDCDKKWQKLLIDLYQPISREEREVAREHEWFLGCSCRRKERETNFSIEATYWTTKKVGNSVKQTKPSSKRKMKIHTRGWNQQNEVVITESGLNQIYGHLSWLIWRNIMVRNLIFTLFKDYLIIESQIALMFLKSLTNQVIMIGSQQ